MEAVMTPTDLLTNLIGSLMVFGVAVLLAVAKEWAATLIARMRSPNATQAEIDAIKAQLEIVLKTTQAAPFKGLPNVDTPPSPPPRKPS